MILKEISLWEGDISQVFILNILSLFSRISCNFHMKWEKIIYLWSYFLKKKNQWPKTTWGWTCFLFCFDPWSNATFLNIYNSMYLNCTAFIFIWLWDVFHVGVSLQSPWVNGWQFNNHSQLSSPGFSNPHDHMQLGQQLTSGPNDPETQSSQVTSRTLRTLPHRV